MKGGCNLSIFFRLFKILLFNSSRLSHYVVNCCNFDVCIKCTFLKTRQVDLYYFIVCTVHLVQFIIHMFYRLYFIIQQQSCEHCNLLILLSCNFNNFVTLAKYKVQTSWRWCSCIETRRRAYDIYNMINIYVVHLLVWIITR